MGNMSIIGKDDIREACRDSSGNYYFRYFNTNILHLVSEKEIKEWCKTFHREDVFKEFAEFFPDDPEFQMETLSFNVPGWMVKEFEDYRDRNSMTTDSAFYRMMKDENEYTKLILNQV